MPIYGEFVTAPRYKLKPHIHLCKFEETQTSLERAIGTKQSIYFLTYTAISVHSISASSRNLCRNRKVA